MKEYVGVSSSAYIIRSVAFALIIANVLNLITPLAVEAASTASSSVGSAASLDPVSNKANRLQMQGASGVDQSTGAFTYSYPITVPAGRNGMAPNLSLNYNSQNTDSGLVGYAWTFNVPYIERVNRTGIDKLYTDNYFVSSLHGEIISKDSYNFYQKVDDGSYAQYTYNNSFWTMKDRDGNVYYFGDNDESKIQSNDKKKTGRWYLHEMRDKFGNGIVYRYTRDTNVNANATTTAGIAGLTSPVSTVYPLSISYTDHALARPLHTVYFNYEDKADKSVSYKYAFPLLDTKRLAYIRINSNGKDVAYYSLGYTVGANGTRSMLNRIEEKHLGTDGEWTTIPPTTFEYEKSEVEFSGSIQNSNDPYNEGYLQILDVNVDGVNEQYFPILTEGAANFGYEVIDINGDFKRDIAQGYMYYSSYVWPYFRYLMNKGGTFTSIVKFKQMPNTQIGFWRNYFVNDMGIPSVQTQSGSQWWWTNTSSVADVNADGFDDIAYSEGGNGIALNNTNSTFTYPSAALANYAININNDQLIDMNGDGLLDRVSKVALDQITAQTQSPSSYNIYLNNGNGYNSASSYSFVESNTPVGFDNGIRFVDVNNDGLVDIVRSYSNTINNANDLQNKIYINNGNGFTLTKFKIPGYLVTHAQCVNLQCHYNTKEYDINGDNTTDYDGSTNNTKKQDVLKNINSPLGAQSSIDYKWTTSDVVPGSGATVSNNSNSLNPNLPIPTYVVSSVTDKLSANLDVNNTANADGIHKVSYKFADGAVYFNPDSPRDRRFAGFGRVEVQDGNQKTVTYYHQGNGDNASTSEKGDSYDNIGRAYRTDTYDSTTNTLKTQDWNLYKSYSAASSTFTYIDSKVSNIYNNDGTYSSIGSRYVYDEAKRLIKTSYDYGEIGNFISFASSTILDSGSDAIITNYEYTNSRPQRLVKKESMDMTGKLLDTTTYNYDGLPTGLATYGAKTSESQMVYNSDGTPYNPASATSSSVAPFTYKNSYTYDATGNVLTQTDIQGRTTRYTYDNNYLLPIKITDANGKSTTITYDPNLLVAKSTVGPDGIKSIKEYDGLGRVTKSYTQASTNAITDQVKNNYVYTGAGFTLYNTKIGVSNNVRSMIAYDAWGREIESKVEKSPELFETLITKYNNLSQVVSKSMPFESYGYGLTNEKAVNGETTYTYDALGRVTTVKSGDNLTNYTYDGKTVFVADNAKTVHKKKYVYDSRSNLAQVVEFNNDMPQTTSYTYNVLGKLTRITDANGNIRNFDYISNGLATYIEDAHSNFDNTFTAYRLKYDNLGRLAQKSGPLGTESYVYDNIDRLITRNVFDKNALQAGSGPSATTTYGYVYDTCANVYTAPCQVNRNNSSTTLAYNQFGMLNSETWKIDNKTFTRSYVYDDFNRLLSVTNPDNGRIVYTYNMLGRQTSVNYIDPSGKNNPIVTDTTWNSWGGLTGMRYANGVQMCNTYTTTSDLGAMAPKLSSSSYIFNTTGCDMSKEPNSIKLYSDTLSYPDSYSPKSITSNIKDIAGVNHTYNQNFAYDGLGRLTSAIAQYDGLATSSSAWTYDAIGNMTSENGIKYNYSADGYQNPNAVTAIGDTHLAYDAQGNRVQSGNSKYIWNSLNQMTSASTTDGIELYSYDDGGERIKRTVIANKIINMKAKPSASSTNYFVDNGLLSAYNTSASNTPNLYISTSTYNRLTAIGMLNRDTLYALANSYYTSPFTAKYCSATPSASRSTCIASTTEQLLASTLASNTLSALGTTTMCASLIAESMMIAKGLASIPTSTTAYNYLATSTIMKATTTSYILNTSLVTDYKNYLATGQADAMTFDYNNVPLVSTTTYASLAQVSLLDNINLKKVMKWAGCNLTPALSQGEGATQNLPCMKIVYGKYSLESSVQLSDQALNEMYLVYQNKAKVPASYGDYATYKFGVVGSKEKINFISITNLGTTTAIVVATSTASTTATSTNSTIDKTYRDLYGARLMVEPRLQYVNTFPYYVTQNTYNELANAGVDQNTFDNYMSTLDRLCILSTQAISVASCSSYILTSASSTEVMYAIKSIIYYEKGVTISDTAARELYFVFLGLGTIPKSIGSYTENASFDVSQYLNYATYYDAQYSSVPVYYNSGCEANYQFYAAFTYCLISANYFSLPSQNSSTTYTLSLNSYDNLSAYNITYTPNAINKYGYAINPATNNNGTTMLLDVTGTVVQNLTGTQSSKVMLTNREVQASWYRPYVASPVKLIATTNTPRATLLDNPVYASYVNPNANVSQVATTSQNTLDPKLIAYWPLATSSLDAKGAFNGTDANMSYSTACGLSTTAACFNGSNSEIKVTNPISLSNKTWTVGYTARFAAIPAGYTSTLSRHNGQNWAATSYYFGLSDGKPIALLGNAGAGAGIILTSTTALSPNVNYNIRYTYDGASVNIYVNGVVVATTATTNMNLNEVVNEMHVGSLFNTWYFMNGGLKDMFVLGYALATATPITSTVSTSTVFGGLNYVVPNLPLNGTISTSTRDLINTPIANYYGKVKEQVSVDTGTTTPMYVSEQTYAELQKTNLKTPYDIAKVFSATTTDYCSHVASTTECDKQARIINAKSLIGYMTGYVPSTAAMEELWMSYKGALQAPIMSTTTQIIYNASTTIASGTISYWPMIDGPKEVSANATTTGTNVIYGPNCAFASSSACFNGGNASAAIANPISLNDKKWTVGFTVNSPNLSGTQYILSRSNGDLLNGTSYAFGLNNGRPFVMTFDKDVWVGGIAMPQTVTSYTVLNSNTTYNIRFSYENYTIKIYINGVNTDSIGIGCVLGANGSCTLNEPGNNYIGSLNGATGYYQGGLRDVFMLNYATSTGYPVIGNENVLATVYDRYTYDLMPHFDRSKLPNILSTIAGTSTIDLTKVPAGLLTDSQFGTLFASSSLANATATRVISEATYNEMLHTPLRTIGDVKALFDYIASSTPTGTLPSEASAKLGAQATLGLIGAYRPSDAAINELYQVYIGKLAIIPTYNFATNTETMTMNVRGRVDLSKAINLTPALSQGEGAAQTPATSTVTYLRLPRVNTALNNLNLTLTTANPYASSSLSYVLRYVTATTSAATSTSSGPSASSTQPSQNATAGTAATSTATSSAFMMSLATTTQIGILYGTTTGNTHLFDLSQIYNNYLAVPHGDLVFAPNFVNASGTIITVGTSTITQAMLSFRRDVTVQPIVYDASLQAVANDRLSGSSTLTSVALAQLVATSSTMIDIDRAPSLGFTSTFFAPMNLAKAGTTTIISSTPTFYKSIEVPIVNMSTAPTSFYMYDCIDQYANGSVTGDWSNCVIGNGMYRGVVAALELKMDKATLASERAKGNKIFLTFKVVSTPQAALPLGTPVTLCLMANVQNNPNCAADPNTRSTTTARVGDIASLPLEWFLDNATWPDPYTLTSMRVGIDYSANPNAGIYLSNATSPFASIVTGSYIANSTSITNATSGKNTADTAITFTYDTYADEASRAMGLGSTPASFTGTPTTPSYLPAVQYPFATSTATTSLYLLTNLSTTSLATSGPSASYTEYTPFSGYTLDTRGFTTTDISINGTVVARYVYTPASSSSPATSTLTYVHTSYLGTPVLETDTKGDIVYIALTDINGNTILRDERNDSTLQNKLYTGHKYDNVTGLTYAHARYLDTRTHTFTSVDPMYYDLSNYNMYDPQGFNSYAYARNNPVSLVDVDGKEFSVTSILNGISNAYISDQVGGLGRKNMPGADYWLGQYIGDNFAVVTGVIEIMGGAGLDGVSGLAIVGTDGAAVIVAVPVVETGTILITHGGATVLTGGKNIVKSNIDNYREIDTTTSEVSSSKNNSSLNNERFGKEFTKKGKKEVIENNKNKNSGKTICENCKIETVPAQKSTKGVTPPKNETQVDHIEAKSKGGAGSPSNGQVLCRNCNIKKSNR